MRNSSSDQVTTFAATSHSQLPSLASCWAALRRASLWRSASTRLVGVVAIPPAYRHPGRWSCVSIRPAADGRPQPVRPLRPRRLPRLPDEPVALGALPGSRCVVPGYAKPAVVHYLDGGAGMSDEDTLKDAADIKSDDEEGTPAHSPTTPEDEG